MNLHCISYNNIGPFAGKTLSVNFRHWAHLIKAPIGTWKSFLFFDGPMYALYKYSQRQMLSRTAEKWWMHCIFSVAWSVWYIQRAITSTKSWNDSTKSRLFALSQSPEEIEQALQKIDSINRDTNLCATIATDAEEITFTNQRELESSLQDLLPAKEVVQSVYMMMQDAQHVFEVTPAERITVFKHLFGLLWIDEAKVTLQTRRKEVQGMLAVLDDQSIENNKIRWALQEIRSWVSSIWNLELSWDQKTLRESLKTLPLITDIDILNEELRIEGLSVSEWEIKTLIDAQKTIQETIIAWATLTWSIQAAQQTLQEKNNSIIQKTNELQTIQSQITLWEKQLASSDSSEFETLTNQKQQLSQKIETINTSLNKESFSQCGVIITTYHEAVSHIESRINQWKTTAKEIEMIDLQIKQQQLHEKDYIAKKKSLEEQLQLLNTQYDEQMKFHCDKIEGDCPYVEMIKGAAWRSMQQQRDLVEKQLKTLEANHASWSKISFDEKKKVLEDKKQSLLSYLKLVWWQTIKAKKDELEIVEKQRTHLDQKLMHLEKQQKETTAIREKIQSLQTQQTLLTKQSESAKKDIEAAKTILESLQFQQSQWWYVNAEKLLQSVQQLTTAHQQIASVIDDYIEKKKNKFELEEELKRLKTLYQIFSKELLVVVLQDFLPQLEEVINAYLSQVASYEVRFLTPTNVDDQLELDITIHDEHGERGVKSLSWWQRALLKICRILAVASLMKSSFLFLDETITSLDAWAVWRVWELIKQFVQKTTMKLYVVTHASEIQDMDLWEEIVEIG